MSLAQPRGYENGHLSEGKLVYFIRGYIVVLPLRKTCYFDDELPAVSALSRSDLKMAERPRAKLTGKVGIHKSIDLKPERQDNISLILFNYTVCDCPLKTTSALLGQCVICTETLVVKPS